MPFTESQILNWARQLGEALEYLHDTHKIVHENLHNGNVMITGLDALNLVKDEEALLNSSIKILDLGFCIFKDSKTGLI